MVVCLNVWACAGLVPALPAQGGINLVRTPVSAQGALNLVRTPVPGPCVRPCAQPCVRHKVHRPCVRPSFRHKVSRPCAAPVAGTSLAQGAQKGVERERETELRVFVMGIDYNLPHRNCC